MRGNGPGDGAHANYDIGIVARGSQFLCLAPMGKTRCGRVDSAGLCPYVSAQSKGARCARFISTGVLTMKIRNSLKALMGRHRANKLVRRRGRVYIINKVDKRYKARQG